MMEYISEPPDPLAHRRITRPMNIRDHTSNGNHGSHGNHGGTSHHSTSKLSSGLRQQQKNGAISGNGASSGTSVSPPNGKSKGSCQAGSVCPFSHSIDPVDQAPCKYFQKGNCKFGAKCALAHILPDGRRVNPRSLHNPSGLGRSLANQQRDSDSPGGHFNTSPRSPIESASKAVRNLYVSVFGDGQSSGSANSGNLSSSSNNLSATTFTMPSPSLNQSDVFFGASSPRNATNSRLSSLPASIWSVPLGSPLAAGSGGSGLNTALGMNTGNASTSLTATASPIRPMPMMAYRSPRTLESDFALDEDEDDLAFEEDFVPSSLTDLLTPQERQRRASKPASASAPPVDLWSNSRYASSLVKRRDESLSETNSGLTSPLRNSFGISSMSSRILEPIGTPTRSSSGHVPEHVMLPEHVMPSSTPVTGNTLQAHDDSTGSESLFDDERIPKTSRASVLVVEDEETQFYMEDDESLQTDTPHRKLTAKLNKLDVNIIQGGIF